jgi:hypothetical protein
MAKQDPEELARLKAFCSLVADGLLDSNDALAPGIFRAIDETTSMRGIRQVVSDLLEWSQDLKGAALDELNAKLNDKGLPTLTLMRVRANKQLADILVRGLIRDEDEYRLVSARRSDVDSDLSESDRALADRLLAEFERGPGE